MSTPGIRIRAAGPKAAKVRSYLADVLPAARLVGEEEPAEIVAMTTEDFEDALEDAAAAAVYARTRDEESVPIEIADRLLSGENPIKVWREYRGITLTALAQRAGLGKGYLSQLESGERKGPVPTMRKIASALGVDLEEVA